MEDVSVIHCCVTNYHRFSSLKPHPLVIAVFMGQEVLCKAAIEVLAWTGVSSEA